MARPGLGIEHVEKLEGDHDTKTRLKLILLSLSGEISVNDAAERLGVCPSRFHELRDEALSGALEALGPRPVGRPQKQRESARVLELERELDRARYEIEVARVRTDLLLVMPEVMSGKRLPPRMKRGGRGGGGSGTKI